MKIAIATPCFVDGDAVGNDVYGMYETLKNLGHEVKIHADHPLTANPIRKIDNVDLYIYHHSIGCKSGVEKFVSLKCKKVLKYHNITPPSFFPKNSESYTACKKGVEQIEEILTQECSVWADSEYNGKQLGVPYTVLPPFNQSSSLGKVVPDYRAVLPYNDWRTNIIMVGRVSPNKDNVAGVEAFHAYNQRNPMSRLIIVGDTNSTYLDDVRQAAQRHGIESKVVITGKVSLEALKAYYLLADCLLVTSKHEGFCVPMVEGMSLRVPVVANHHCALPYTGGDAVRLTADDPESIADGIVDVLLNRQKYVVQGLKRYAEHYNPSVIASALEGLTSEMAAK